MCFSFSGKIRKQLQGVSLNSTWGNIKGLGEEMEGVKACGVISRFILGVSLKVNTSFSVGSVSKGA